MSGLVASVRREVAKYDQGPGDGALYFVPRLLDAG